MVKFFQYIKNLCLKVVKNNINNKFRSYYGLLNQKTKNFFDKNKLKDFTIFQNQKIFNNQMSTGYFIVKKVLINLVLGIFIISIILIFLYLYTLDIFLWLYPDKLIQFFNSMIDEEAFGFTFLFSFLPFSTYFFPLNNLHVGVFKNYQFKIQQRLILLLQYLGSYSPLFKKKRLHSKTFLNVFFSKLNIWEKSRLYMVHKIGSFRTKDFILNFHKNHYWFTSEKKKKLLYFDKKNWFPFNQFYKQRKSMYNLYEGNRQIVPFNFKSSNDLKNHLANINPFVNVINNFPLTDWQPVVKYSQFSKLLKKPWYLKLYISKLKNQNYFWFIKPDLMRPQYEGQFYDRFIQRYGRKRRKRVKIFPKLVKWQIFSRAYASPGVYYLHSNLRKYFFGLHNKIILKSYLPFFNIRLRGSEQMLANLKHSYLDDTWRINLFTGGVYNYLFSLVFWNWASSDAALSKYYLSRRYHYIFSPDAISSIFFVNYRFPINYNPYFLYRSNVFRLNYLLYLVEIYNVNQVKPIFDSHLDTNHTNRFLESLSTNHYDNSQLNEFFSDFSDYDFFNGLKYRRATFMNDWLINRKRTTKNRILSGNYSYFSESKRAVEDYSFFKNFYYRYKYKFVKNFYLKPIVSVNEFYTIYLDLKSEHLNFSIFYIFLVFFNFIKKYFENFFFSIFFIFLYYFNLIYMPLFLFLKAHTFKGTFLWFLQQIFIYTYFFISYFINDVLYTFISLKSFLFNSSLYIPFFFFIYKFLLLMLIAYIFLIFIENYYVEDELKMRYFILLFICFIFFITYIHFHIYIWGFIAGLDAG
jgi:hypothetical protein